MQPIGYTLNALARVQGVACHAAGWKSFNKLERVRIKIKFTFGVEAFERHNYIRAFNVCHEIHDWPAAEKYITGLFKAVVTVFPKPFTRRQRIMLRKNSVRLTDSKLGSDGEDSFASDFGFHD